MPTQAQGEVRSLDETTRLLLALAKALDQNHPHEAKALRRIARQK